MSGIIEVDTPLGHFTCYDDIVGHALQAGQFWDQQIQAALDSADPSGVAIDIGANIGWFSIYLAQRHPQVIAVEAHPQTFQLLRMNVRTCGMIGRVTCLNVAAYDRDIPLALASPAAVGWDWDGSYDLATCPHPASIVYMPTTGPGQVNGHALDPLMGVDQVTLIKVDAQGCDLRALQGLQKTIARCRPVIVFEYEDSPSKWNGTNWEDYLDFFRQLSYTVSRIREDLWDYVATPIMSAQNCGCDPGADHKCERHR